MSEPAASLHHLSAGRFVSRLFEGIEPLLLEAAVVLSVSASL